MEGIIGKVLTAAKMVTFYWRKQGSGHYPEGFQQHLDQKHAYEADIWAHPTGDPTKPTVEKMIEEAEALTRPVIEGQGK